MKVKLSNNLKLYGASKEVIEHIKKEFTVLNPKWLENHKMGRWNKGTPKHIKLYKKTKSFISVPIGAKEEVFTYLTKQKIRFGVYEVQKTKKADIRFTGSLRDYQTPACQDMIAYTTGTLQAATGGGKTIMGLFCIAYRKQKTLIIVHTKDLLNQWRNACAKFTNVGYDELGQIGDGKFKIGDKITIGIINSIYNRMDEIKKEFGFVLTDECHRCPSRTFTEALEKFNCRYRLGLSATPFRKDGLTKLIDWYCGPLRHVVDRDKLIEYGHILQPIFIMRETSYDCGEIDPIGEYSKLLNDLTSNEKRNNQIANDIRTSAKNKSNTIIVLSDRKAHCYALNAFLKKRKVKSSVLTGDVKNRQEVIDSIGKECNVLIATGQLIGEGFDCPDLNMMYLVSPFKYIGRVLQYIGRVMRPAPNKDRPIVYDYVDWGVDVLANSARARMRVYKKENIRYE